MQSSCIDAIILLAQRSQHWRRSFNEYERINFSPLNPVHLHDLSASENYHRILVISTAILTGEILRNVCISNFRRLVDFAFIWKFPIRTLSRRIVRESTPALSCVCKYVESRGRPGLLDRASKSRKNSCHSFQELIKKRSRNGRRSFGLPAQYGDPTANTSEEIALQHFDVEHACDVSQYYITI